MKYNVHQQSDQCKHIFNALFTLSEEVIGTFSCTDTDTAVAAPDPSALFNTMVFTITSGDDNPTKFTMDSTNQQIKTVSSRVNFFVVRLTYQWMTKD